MEKNPKKNLTQPHKHPKSILASNGQKGEHDSKQHLTIQEKNAH